MVIVTTVRVLLNYTTKLLDAVSTHLTTTPHTPAWYACFKSILTLGNDIIDDDDRSSGYEDEDEEDDEECDHETVEIPSPVVSLSSTSSTRSLDEGEEEEVDTMAEGESIFHALHILSTHPPEEVIGRLTNRQKAVKLPLHRLHSKEKIEVTVESLQVVVILL